MEELKRNLEVELTGLSEDLEVTCRKRGGSVKDTSSLNGAVVCRDGEVWENEVGATSPVSKDNKCAEL